MNERKLLDISWATIFKVLLALVFFYLLYLIRDILVYFVFALIISLLFNPAIDFLQKRKIPRPLSVIFVYVSAFGLFSFFIYLSFPLVIYDIKQLLDFLPQYFEKISPPLQGLGFQAFENLETFTAAFNKTLEKMAGNIFSVLFAVFGGIFSASFVVTIAAFLSSEQNAVERSLGLLFPKKYEPYVISIWEKCQKKVAGWFGTRLIACGFVAILSYIAFLLFDVNYPFGLSLLAGALNFIPLIGPVLTGLLIFSMVALSSMLKAIFVLLVFILIQQIENNILTPLLTRKFIGLPSVLVLIALVVGAKLWGILGAVLVVPLAGIMFEFLKDFLKKRREMERAI